MLSWEMRDIEKFDLGHLHSRAEQKYFFETLLGLSEADLTKFFFPNGPRGGLDFTKKIHCQSHSFEEQKKLK